MTTNVEKSIDITQLTDARTLACAGSRVPGEMPMRLAAGEDDMARTAAATRQRIEAATSGRLARPRRLRAAGLLVHPTAEEGLHADR